MTRTFCAVHPVAGFGGGQVFEFEDLGVLRGLDPLEAGLEPGGLRVSFG